MKIHLLSGATSDCVKAHVSDDGLNLFVDVRYRSNFIDPTRHRECFTTPSGTSLLFTPTDMRMVAFGAAASKLPRDERKEVWSRMTIDLPFEVETDFYEEDVIPGQEFIMCDDGIFLNVELVGVSRVRPAKASKLPGIRVVPTRGFASNTYFSPTTGRGRPGAGGFNFHMPAPPQAPPQPRPHGSNRGSGGFNSQPIGAPFGHSRGFSRRTQRFSSSRGRKVQQNPPSNVTMASRQAPGGFLFENSLGNVAGSQISPSAKNPQVENGAVPTGTRVLDGIIASFKSGNQENLPQSPSKRGVGVAFETVDDNGGDVDADMESDYSHGHAKLARRNSFNFDLECPKASKIITQDDLASVAEINDENGQEITTVKQLYEQTCHFDY